MGVQAPLGRSPAGINIGFGTIHVIGALLSSTHQRSTLCSVHLVGVQGTAALGAGGGSAENRNPVQP